MCLTLKWWIVLSFVWHSKVRTLANFTTAGYGQAFDIDDSNDEFNGTTQISVSEEQTTKNKDLSMVLKLATECETPNHDPGYCMEINQCPKLFKQLPNINARQFLLASKCGPPNEDAKRPKVCCGKYDNFKQASDNVDDRMVFPKRCGFKKITILRSRILGGTKAAIGEFPWMARLVHENEHGYKSVGCSAFLVHTKYVVTAAHCVHKTFTKIRGPVFSVILGEHNTETKVDCNPTGTLCADPLQISRVAKVIVHPGYNVELSGHYNDIAIIHMKRAARITDFVQPICLQMDHEAKLPEKYVISGWGKTEEEAFSTIKMKLELPAVSITVCRDKYSTLDIELRDSQICAGGEEGKDSCSGDSGGPLMMENGTNYLAAGVVSYGIGCGIEGWPGVYTNIASFVPWIKQQIIANSYVGTKNPQKKKNHKKTNGATKG